jgi:hypothetical protein
MLPDDTSVYCLGLSKFLAHRLESDLGLADVGALRREQAKDGRPLANVLADYSGVSAEAARCIALAMLGPVERCPTCASPLHHDEIGDAWTCPACEAPVSKAPGVAQALAEAQPAPEPPFPRTVAWNAEQTAYLRDRLDSVESPPTGAGSGPCKRCGKPLQWLTVGQVWVCLEKGCAGKPPPTDEQPGSPALAALVEAQGGPKKKRASKKGGKGAPAPTAAEAQKTWDQALENARRMDAEGVVPLADEEG